MLIRATKAGYNSVKGKSMNNGLHHLSSFACVYLQAGRQRFL